MILHVLDAVLPLSLLISHKCMINLALSARFHYKGKIQTFSYSSSAIHLTVPCTPAQRARDPPARALRGLDAHDHSNAGVQLLCGQFAELPAYQATAHDLYSGELFFYLAPMGIFTCSNETFPSLMTYLPGSIPTRARVLFLDRTLSLCPAGSDQASAANGSSFDIFPDSG